MCARIQPLGATQRAVAASSGMPAAQASNSALSGARSASVREGDVERPPVERPQLGEGQPDRLHRVLVLLGERDVRHGRVVRVERHGHAVPMQAGERVRGEAGHDAGLPVRGRAEVEGHAVGRSGPGTATDRRPRPARGRSARGPSRARVGPARPRPTRRRAAVIRRPPARAASNARAWVSGSGKAASGPARSQPVRPRSRKRAAVSASSTFASGSWERSAVQISRTVVPVRAAASAAPAQTAAIPSASGQAAGHVQQRTPADLDVADVVGRLRLDELGGDPLEGLGVLHQGDRQVERAQELGLRRAGHRRDERSRHAGPVARGVDAAGPGELDRGVHAQRAVEVEVELGLGHRPDEPRGASGREGPAQRRRRVSGVGHPPMLRFLAHVHHPGHRRLRVRRQLGGARTARRRPRHRRPRPRTGIGASACSGACPPRGAAASRRAPATSPTRRRWAPRSTASTASSTSPPSRATSTAAPSSAS